MEEYKFLGGSTELGESNVSVEVKFRRFVQEAQEHYGKVYAYLAEKIADDKEILRIAEKTQLPNTFFAAVHFLLLNDRKDTLALYYASITPSPLPIDGYGGFPAFKSFVMRNEYNLTQVLKTGTTQTNEVGRCAYLLPAFQTVYELGKSKPLSLIDVGCSAGFHLLWDKYHYEYRGEEHDFAQIGDRNNPVTIYCGVRGANYPPIPTHFPPCVFRVGIDLDPISLRIGKQRTWLESFVFPDREHTGRRDQLQLAIMMALKYPPQVLEGDVIKVLPDIFPTVPDNTTLCIYHSHAMYQLNQELWDRFETMLVSMSNIRDIFWIIAEGYELHLRHLHNGTIKSEKLANKAAHGNWLEWVKEAI